MAKYVTIRIDGIEADVGDPQGLPLSFVYSVADAEELGKLEGATTSRTIKLPPTQVNNAIYQRFVQLSRINTDAAKRLPCVIEVNGLPVFSGRAQLKTATGRGGKYLRSPSGYEVQLFGNNADWFDQIRAAKIKDYDYGTYTLSKANIETWGDNSYGAGDDICMTLIKWRAWEGGTFIKHKEHTFGLFIKSILDKAFNGIGYTIESDFMDTDFFERLIMPIPYRPYSQDYLYENTNARVATSVQQTYSHTSAGPIIHNVNHLKESPAPYYDNGGNYGVNTYTAPETGLYTARATITSSAIPGPLNAIEGRIYHGSSAAASVAIPADGVYQVSFVDKQLTAGDTLIVKVKTDGSPSYTIGIDSIFEVEFYKDPTSWDIGDSIELRHMIPGEWLVKDVLLDLQHIFNLRFETDPDAQTVRIEPADRYVISWRQNPVAGTRQTKVGFFRPSPLVAANFTGKVDYSKAGEVNNRTDIREDYELAWKTDTGDETVERMEEEAALKIYDARYNFPADRFAAGTTRKETQFFSKTVHIFDSDIQSSATSAPIPQVPLIFGDDYFTSSASTAYNYDIEPRMLYFAGRRTGAIDGRIEVGDTSSATSAHALPASWMVNYNDTSVSNGYALDPALSFGTEYTQEGNATAPLMLRYHMQSIKRLEVGKLVTDYLYWTDLNILGLSFRNKISIDDDLYILKKIDGYKPYRGGSTKTELIKDEMPEDGDLSNIESSDIDGRT